MQTRKMTTTRPGHSGDSGSVCSQAGYVAEVSRKPVWRTQKQRACHGLTERSGCRSLRLEQVQDKATGQRDRFARSSDGYTWDGRCPVTRMPPIMQN